MDDQLKKIIQEAVAPLSGPSATETAAGAQRLGAAGVQSLGDLLSVGPDHPAEGELRALAYWLLGRSDLDAAGAALLRGLDDRHAPARREAVAALGHPTAGPVIRRLERLLASDPDVSVRIAAALALGGRTAAGTGPLIAALRNFRQPPAVRGAAAEALARCDGDAARPALLDALNDPEPEVRGWAAFAIGERGDRAALPRLDELASTDRARVPGLGTVADEALAAAAAIRSSTLAG